MGPSGPQTVTSKFNSHWQGHGLWDSEVWSWVELQGDILEHLWSTGEGGHQ